MPASDDIKVDSRSRDQALIGHAPANQVASAFSVFNRASLREDPLPNDVATQLDHRQQNASRFRQLCCRCIINKDQQACHCLRCRRCMRVVACVVAAILTWLERNWRREDLKHKQSNPALASAIISLVMAALSPPVGPAAMTGTFTGMTSTTVLPGFGWFLVAAGLTSLLFELALLCGWGNGFGGRLGLIAFIAVNITVGLQVYLREGSPTKTLQVDPFRGSGYHWPPDHLPMFAFVEAVGSLATILLRRYNHQDSCAAAAIVGVIGTVTLGALFTDVAAFELYGGTFVGMGDSRKLEAGLEWHRLRTPLVFVLVGGLAGGIHGLTLVRFYTEGWGGLLGTCSWVAFLLYHYLASMAMRLTKWSISRWPQRSGDSDQMPDDGSRPASASV